MLDIRDQSRRSLFGRFERCGGSEEEWIDSEKAPGLMVGGSAHHHAVEHAEMRLSLLQAGNPPIEHNLQVGMCRLQPIHERIIERRLFTVFTWRQTFEPGLSSVDNEGIGTGGFHGLSKIKKGTFGILFINADAAFDGHRHRNGGFHCRHAIADQPRLGHQAGSEPTFLNTIRRASNVEIDFVVAEIGADAGRLRKCLRIASTKLKANRMLERVKGEKTPTIAMQHRARREHLRVDQRMPCEQTVKIPAVPVRPVHHRRDTKSMGQTLRRFALFFSHLSTFIHSRCRTISGPFWPILPSVVRHCRTFLVVSYRLDLWNRLALATDREHENRYDKNGLKSPTSFSNRQQETVATKKKPHTTGY